MIQLKCVLSVYKTSMYLNHSQLNSVCFLKQKKVRYVQKMYLPKCIIFRIEKP